MSSDPIFYSVLPRTDKCTLDTANTNRDGTGTIVTLVTGAAAGSRVERIEAHAQATTTAGMIRLFRSSDGGSTWTPWRDILVTATTVSASVGAFHAELDLRGTPVLLKDANSKIGAAPHTIDAGNKFYLYATVADAG